MALRGLEPRPYIISAVQGEPFHTSNIHLTVPMPQFLLFPNNTIAHTGHVQNQRLPVKHITGALDTRMCHMRKVKYFKERPAIDE